MYCIFTYNSRETFAALNPLVQLSKFQPKTEYALTIILTRDFQKKKASLSQTMNIKITEHPRPVRHIHTISSVIKVSHENGRKKGKGEEKLRRRKKETVV